MPAKHLKTVAQRHGQPFGSRKTTHGKGRRYTLRDFKTRFASWRRLPFRDRLRRVRRLIVTLFLWGALVVVLGGGIGYIVIAHDLPDPEKLLDRDLAQSTKIYDRTGQILLYEIHGDEKRTVVPLSDIPDYMEKATISVEDKEFYKHPGFNARRIVVTMFTNVVEGELAGASTITQQLVKNSILSPEKTYSRKLKEFILAVKLERAFEKDEILEMYLNEIPYGSNAYGVESAAQTYFGKRVRDITLAEAATLAAFPQRPTYYWNHQDELLQRKDYVLDEMVNDGHLSAEDADAAKQEEIVFNRRRENITAPHFVLSYVRPYLEERYGEEVVERGGLTVITTLDANHQQWAEEAVTGGRDKVTSRGGSNAALVSMDTKTKQILTMVGSFDYFDTEHDGQTNAASPPVPRSPGSSLKPILYGTAFEAGFTPDTRVWDLTTSFPGYSTPPHNFDFKERGPITLRQALQGSLNIPAIRLFYLVGFDRFYDNVENLGYTTFGDRPPVLSIVVGGGGVRLVEHVYAYATIAREGEKHPLTSVLKVTDANGEVLEEWKESDPVQAFDRDAARTLNSVLTDDGARAYIFGRGSYLTLPGREVAAKTGTSQDNVDNWTVGYTPSIAAGVWVGNNDNSPMHRNADGSGTAAPIWNAYMRKATENHPAETFKRPTPKQPENRWLTGQIDELISYPVDVSTGKVIPESCLSTYPQEYITTKEFKVTHNELHYIDRNKPSGPPPKNPTALKYYEQWEAPVRAWASSQPGYLVGDPEYTDCSLRNPEKQPTVEILSPSEGEHVTPDTFAIDTSMSAGQGGAISRVEYFIDGNLVDSKTSTPFNSTYSPNSLTAGRHELRVDVTNSFTNRASASVNFLFAVSDAQNLLITKPTEDALTENVDTTVTLSVTNPDAIQRMDLFEVRNGQETLITTIPSPSKKNTNVSWNTGAAGTVQLYFVATYVAGGAQTSDRRNYAITATP